MLAIVTPGEPRRGARAVRAVGDPRDGGRPRHRHRPLPCVRRPVRRGRRARGEPAAAVGDEPPEVSSDREPVADVPGRQPRRRSRVPPAARPPADHDALPGRRPGARCSRRASRPAPTSRAELLALLVVADHRRQVVGVPPVRPPALPQHRRRSRWRRHRAAAQGHAPAALAVVDRRQGPLLRARPAHRRRASSCSRPRATSPARARDPKALVNCLNFGNPEHPEVMWQFSEVVDGMSEACTALGIPVDRRQRELLQRVAAAPTSTPRPVVGRDRPHRRPRRRRRPAPGSPTATRSCVLGADRAELGGSEWATLSTACATACRRSADLDAAVRAARPGAPISCATAWSHGVHDCADGGLAVALAEMAIAGEVGFTVAPEAGVPAAAWCFSESASRVVLAVDPRPRRRGARAGGRRRACRPATSVGPGGDRLVADRRVRRSTSPTPTARLARRIPDARSMPTSTI